MLFPTVGFTAFFLIFLLLWWALPQRGAAARAGLLLVGSLVFYSAADWRWVGVLLGVGGLTWAGSRWIEAAQGRGDGI